MKLSKIIIENFRSYSHRVELSIEVYLLLQYIQ